MNYTSENKPPSQLIRDAIKNKENTPKVKDLIDVFGSQSFGLMFIIMALPLTIPLPPGIGFIPAALLCAWALQRAFGGTFLWVPKAVGKWKLSQKFIINIETKALPLCERLEKKFLNSSQPRTLSEMEIRLASVMVAFFSILIMLPTPFLNSIFAVIIILTGLIILSGNRKLLWINVSFALLALFFIGSALFANMEVLLGEIYELL